MTSKRHINAQGLGLIKHFEGLSLEPYMDDNDGWTIGYGHLYPRGVAIPDKITEAEAETLLMTDVAWAERVVDGAAPDSLTDNQFSALVSFVYNIGPCNFRKSTLFKKLIQGDIAGIPYEIMRWVKDDGKVMKGLIKRRIAERKLFETED
jgi:lysozyme